MLLERPAAPAQKMMLVTSNDGGGGMSSMTYDSRLQYKTPNVTDRVRTEQTKDQSLVQVRCIIQSSLSNLNIIKINCDSSQVFISIFAQIFHAWLF